MSWAPFVGVFIARISRGRTVREFVTGVLLVPTLVTFLWFSVMGGSAIYREMFGDGGLVGDDGAVSTDAALFQFLEGLPASGLLSVAAMILVIVFFVTSSDSGSFVVDMLASGGNPQPPVWSRVFWAVLEGVIAATLLVAGAVNGGDGLGALQTMAILLALPFSLVMIGMMVATAKALLHETWLMPARRAPPARRRGRRGGGPRERIGSGTDPRRPAPGPHAHVRLTPPGTPSGGSGEPGGVLQPRPGAGARVRGRTAWWRQQAGGPLDAVVPEAAGRRGGLHGGQPHARVGTLGVVAQHRAGDRRGSAAATPARRGCRPSRGASTATVMPSPAHRSASSGAISTCIRLERAYAVVGE